MPTVLSTSSAKKPASQAREARRVDRITLAAIVVLLVCAAATHGPVFGNFDGYRAAFGGVLIGTLIAVAGARWRWTVVETLLAATVAYLFAGGVFALPSTTSFGFLPSLDTLQGLVIGAVDSWKDLLTLSPPAGQFVGPAVVPFLASLVCTLAALTIGLRTQKHQEWSLLFVAILAAIGVLWGSQYAPLAEVLAALATTVAISWGSWISRRRRREAGIGIVADDEVDDRARRRRRTIFGSVGMISVALATALILAPVLNGNTPRETLRDHVEPPLDLTEYHSPLSSYRYWMDNQKESTLFSVTGLQEGQRIRLATLDTYDGTVMRVGTDNATEGFSRIGQEVSEGALTPGTSTSDLDITIADYNNYWIPGGGVVEEIDYTGADEQEFYDSLYYSSILETLLSARGMTTDDTYTVTVVDQEEWSDSQLKDKSFGKVSLPSLSNVPDSVSERLPEFLGDAETPIEKVRAISDYFSTQGFYSDGTDNDSLPSHSAARLDVFLDDTKFMIGDDEQYAVAMALMCREADIPARVVVGFYPEEYAEGTIEITGTDAHAWVEVNFSGVGWVAFDPTPPRDQIKRSEMPEPVPNPRPQVLQPPIQPEDPADINPEVNEDDDPKGDEPNTWLPWVILGAKVIGGILLLLSPFFLIMLIKALRWRQRRRAEKAQDQITGSWNELIDRATDLGTAVPRWGTRLEQARHLDALSGTGESLARFHPRPEPGSASALALSVDGADYGGQETTPEQATSTWEQTESLLVSLNTGVSRGRRMRARISLKSLRLYTQESRILRKKAGK